MTNKYYPDSVWYRVGDVRIVPGIFGFMQAQELWQRDSYDIEGEVTGYNTQWKRVGQIPSELSNENFFSMLASKPEHTYSYMWKLLTSFFKGTGCKDPVPRTPAKVNEDWRNYERKKEEEQRIADGYVSPINMEGFKKQYESDQQFRHQIQDYLESQDCTFSLHKGGPADFE